MRLWTVLLVLFIAGCSSTSSTQGSNSSVTQPVQVDAASDKSDTMTYRGLAAALYPKTLETVGVFKVKATGDIKGRVFLNTEYDYRDPRNITVVIPPKLAAEFEQKHKTSPKTYFLNKQIFVKGELAQVKIWFAFNGKRSSKYYYQTHIRIASLDDIRLLSKNESS